MSETRLKIGALWPILFKSGQILLLFPEIRNVFGIKLEQFCDFFKKFRPFHFKFLRPIDFCEPDSEAVTNT